MLRRVRVTIFAVLNVSVGLIIQHAKSMLRTVLTSLVCLAVPYYEYFNCLTNGTIFGGEKSY
jgi:hypothetical protein